MKLSFRARICLPIIAIVVLSFLVMGIALNVIFSREILKAAVDGAWNLSYRYGNFIKGKLDVASNVALAVSDTAVSLAEEDEGDKASAVIDYLTKVIQDNPSVFSVWTAYSVDAGFDGEFA
ncbi:MAG: hypothetical protein LBP51_00225, partial [Deferribacteraceae bacterium]|nr:hypothetical protein [Deferribacteraceae bacterium]